MDVTEDLVVLCAACRERVRPDDGFCEQCGASTGLAPVEDASEEGCHACGSDAAAIDADGYCAACGVRSRRSGARVELDLAVAAAVSDQGRLHVRNDDAFHVERYERGVVAVVCDGISMSASADLAARTAATAAGSALVEALRGGSSGSAASAAAIGAAQAAVERLEKARRDDLADPSCTFVSAVCSTDEIVVAWAGDSRAYWLGPEPRLLTVDNSWAEEQVAAGALSAEQAAMDPRARSVTRWVGPDAPDDPPQIVTYRPVERGRLVLCSDGLSSYAPGAAELMHAVEQLPAAASALAAARTLADTALARGGHDDVTVVVVDARPKGGDLP